MRRILNIGGAFAGVALVVLLAGTAAMAANQGPSREAAMKKIGGSMALLAGIAKSEKPYDAAVVKSSLETISATIKTFPGYFPDDSIEDDRNASPRIWESKDDFKSRAAKLGVDAGQLLAALPSDPKEVGAAMMKLGANCSGCHKLYRLKR